MQCRRSQYGTLRAELLEEGRQGVSHHFLDVIQKQLAAARSRLPARDQHLLSQAPTHWWHWSAADPFASSDAELADVGRRCKPALAAALSQAGAATVWLGELARGLVTDRFDLSHRLAVEVLIEHLRQSRQSVWETVWGTVSLCLIAVLGISLVNPRLRAVALLGLVAVFIFMRLLQRRFALPPAARTLPPSLPWPRFFTWLTWVSGAAPAAQKLTAGQAIDAADLVRRHEQVQNNLEFVWGIRSATAVRALHALAERVGADLADLTAADAELAAILPDHLRGAAIAGYTAWLTSRGGGRDIPITRDLETPAQDLVEWAWQGYERHGPGLLGDGESLSLAAAAEAAARRALLRRYPEIGLNAFPTGARIALAAWECLIMGHAIGRNEDRLAGSRPRQGGHTAVH